VRDANNSNPISAASVAAMDSLGATYNAATDGSGHYQLIGLPIGTYTVTASAGAYKADVATGVSIAAGVTTTQNFSLTALPQADLGLIKIASAATITPNSALSYTLSVSNHGPDAITTTVTVTDVLPAGYVFSSATGAGWTCSGTTTIVCTRTALGVGMSASISLNGTTPATTGLITNTAIVASDLLDSAPANNTAHVTTSVTAEFSVYLPIVLR
jgi:uncharacterized repeat protein (TIGR01451 family)